MESIKGLLDKISVNLISKTALSILDKMSVLKSKPTSQFPYSCTDRSEDMSFPVLSSKLWISKGMLTNDNELVPIADFISPSSSLIESSFHVEEFNLWPTTDFDQSKSSPKSPSSSYIFMQDDPLFPTIVRHPPIIELVGNI